MPPGCRAGTASDAASAAAGVCFDGSGINGCAAGKSKGEVLPAGGNSNAARGGIETPGAAGDWGTTGIIGAMGIIGATGAIGAAGWASSRRRLKLRQRQFARPRRGRMGNPRRRLKLRQRNLADTLLGRGIVAARPARIAGTTNSPRNTDTCTAVPACDGSPSNTCPRGQKNWNAIR